MKQFLKHLAKMRRWAAFQERNLVEAKIKLASMGVPQSQAVEVLEKLTEEGFINEERYAKLYAGSKFRNKRWGKQRIAGEMRANQISEEHIELALREIGDEEYRQVISDMIESKVIDSDPANMNLFKYRLSKSVVAKGYEPELVMDMIDEAMNKKMTK